MSEPRSDLDLVAGARAGRRDDFAELVRRHHPAILGLCVSMLGDREEADDAAQEAFLKAYRSLGRFQGDSAFSTWVYRIASNHCLDRLRKRAREKSDSLEALLEAGGDAAEAALGQAPSGAQALEDAELVERALSALPPDYRLILVLRETQGLDYRELTQALDCSLDAVKTRLKRARRQLEQNLRHLLGGSNV